MEPPQAPGESKPAPVGPVLIVEPATPARTDPLMVRFANIAPAAAGTHYRLWLRVALPTFDARRLPACAFVKVHDWVDPAGTITLTARESDGSGKAEWCAGTATLSLVEVPDLSELAVRGAEVASTRVAIA